MNLITIVMNTIIDIIMIITFTTITFIPSSIGYAVVFIYRKGSILPYTRSLSLKTSSSNDEYHLLSKLSYEGLKHYLICMYVCIYIYVCLCISVFSYIFNEVVLLIIIVYHIAMSTLIYISIHPLCILYTFTLSK
jgi:hypothetical protein